MNSLIATNEVCELPVYRPLIGFDKQEIVEVSEKIGTYETSILPMKIVVPSSVGKTSRDETEREGDPQT